MISRDTCAARDVSDRLAPLRALFAMERVDRQGVIYLDGNSLGVLPAATPARLAEVAESEWGEGLIRSWNEAGLPRAKSAESRGWITLSQRIGDKIARLIGAGPGEVMVGDSTSVNLFKVLSAAVAMNDPPKPLAKADRIGKADRMATAGRIRIVSERTNFPTDLYIADTLARDKGYELTLVDQPAIASHLDNRTAILMLTHVNYRTGFMHDMAALTARAHEAGVLVIWDLAHSAGAMPVDVASADFAVGCGYKYLNGGPGAPAFAWVHPTHTAWMDRKGWRQPLSGWLGHAAPFAFSSEYEPAKGISRFVCGTPPVLSLAALECGVDTVLAAEDAGGLEAIREKSVALTDLFIRLVETRCAAHDLTLISPPNAGERGSQVSLAHPTHGYEIMQALVARGVIGDFRAPDILRFGFTPLYTRFVDVWDAVDRLRGVLESGEWREPRFAVRAAVT
jgi:kynureninase